MKRLLLVLLVGVLALAAGAAVAGRPVSVPNDVVIDQRPSSPSTDGTIGSRTTTMSTSTTTSAEPDVTVGDSGPRPQPTAGPTPTDPAEPSSSTTLVPESGLRVAVANGTNAPGLATEYALILNGLGYLDTTATDAAEGTAAAAVYFSDGFRSEAQRLAQQIGLNENAVQALPGRPLTLDDVDADLWLVVGADRVP